MPGIAAAVPLHRLQSEAPPHPCLPAHSSAAPWDNWDPMEHKPLLPSGQPESPRPSPSCVPDKLLLVLPALLPSCVDDVRVDWRAGSTRHSSTIALRTLRPPLPVSSPPAPRITGVHTRTR